MVVLMIRLIIGLASVYRERSSIVDNQHGLTLSDVEEMTHHGHVRQGIPRVLIALYQTLQRLPHGVLPCVTPHVSARSLDEMMGRA